METARATADALEVAIDTQSDPQRSLLLGYDQGIRPCCGGPQQVVAHAAEPTPATPVKPVASLMPTVFVPKQCAITALSVAHALFYTHF